MKIKSLYVCVNDMKRAINFYTNFFEVKPVKEDNVYSVFDINGFRYGLFAYKEMNEEHSFGSNCLPSIEVDDIKILKEKISHLEICLNMFSFNSDWK